MPVITQQHVLRLDVAVADRLLQRVQSLHPEHNVPGAGGGAGEAMRCDTGSAAVNVCGMMEEGGGSQEGGPQLLVSHGTALSLRNLIGQAASRAQLHQQIYLCAHASSAIHHSVFISIDKLHDVRVLAKLSH